MIDQRWFRGICSYALGRNSDLRAGGRWMGLVGEKPAQVWEMTRCAAYGEVKAGQVCLEVSRQASWGTHTRSPQQGAGPGPLPACVNVCSQPTLATDRKRFLPRIRFTGSVFLHFQHTHKHTSTRDHEPQRS